MEQLTRPRCLRPGDTVAAVSLSWGAAGNPDIRWKYELGKQRIQTLLGLRVMEMPHTLAPEAFVRDHPEARAADLMQAFEDPAVQGIFCCIGGEDSLRMLPWLDFSVIRRNPKVFTGYSDSTVSQFVCMKAGLGGFYGCHVLNDFAENGSMAEYSLDSIRQMLFCPEPPGIITPAEAWCAGDEDWTRRELRDICRTYRQEAHGTQVLQGHGTARGRLLGGCMSVVEELKDTPLFPPPQAFADTILFFEVVSWPPEAVAEALRDYARRGCLSQVRGILFGKPYGENGYDAYRNALTHTLAELGYAQLPLFYNMSFGHNDPKFLIPYGGLAEMDCDTGTFSILEAGVTL